MKYQPKRSSQRWLKGAPEYVLACYDNRGKTVDRFTIILGGSLWDESMGRTVNYLGLSSYPEHPQGFSQWGEVNPGYRPPSRDKVTWLDIPENIRAHIIARATQDN